MTRPGARIIADELRDILASFERDGESALSRLAELYDAGLVFSDPLQTLAGRDAFIAMNRRIIRRARSLSFEVKEATGDEDKIFLTWVMTYRPRRGPTIFFEGATFARVRGGLIAEQRDYWDLLSSVARSVPGLRRVYAALAPRLG
jgi:steroid Delta-isomerase